MECRNIMQRCYSVSVEGKVSIQVCRWGYRFPGISIGSNAKKIKAAVARSTITMETGQSQVAVGLRSHQNDSSSYNESKQLREIILFPSFNSL
jgi:hypothetical protein